MAAMRPLARVHWLIAVLIAGGAAAVCQSTLPATAPTMREIEEQPASVEYADGRVAVLAENSSLSEIIRDVARCAGMAVKGSIVDERVFGTYGPAAPAEVLTELLKGTGSNMLVLAGSSHVPELILTPKQGGPTPPRPVAQMAESEALEEAGSSGARAAGGGERGMGEQPVQASTDSDTAGLLQENAGSQVTDAEPDAKPAAQAEDRNSPEHPAEAAAQ
jgi:hypothetical protein